MQLLVVTAGQKLWTELHMCLCREARGNQNGLGRQYASLQPALHYHQTNGRTAQMKGHSRAQETLVPPAVTPGGNITILVSSY